MKVPGRAWLQYDVLAADSGSRLVQTAFFEPKGLPGLVYWYALYPVHGLIFRGTDPGRRGASGSPAGAYEVVAAFVADDPALSLMGVSSLRAGDWCARDRDVRGSADPVNRYDGAAIPQALCPKQTFGLGGRS